VCSSRRGRWRSRRPCRQRRRRRRDRRHGRGCRYRRARRLRSGSCGALRSRGWWRRGRFGSRRRFGRRRRSGLRTRNWVRRSCRLAQPRLVIRCADLGRRAVRRASRDQDREADRQTDRRAYESEAELSESAHVADHLSGVLRPHEVPVSVALHLATRALPEDKVARQDVPGTRSLSLLRHVAEEIHHDF